MNTLIFRRPTNATDVQKGFVYIHTWETGFQELVFPTHEAAKGFESASNSRTTQQTTNTLRQELIELYMQGWLDRDWKIGDEEANEKASLYVDQLMKKYNLI